MKGKMGWLKKGLLLEIQMIKLLKYFNKYNNKEIVWVINREIKASIITMIQDINSSFNNKSNYKINRTFQIKE